jgi:Alpha/beta hydrolase family/Zinc dependent phospholipase C
MPGAGTHTTIIQRLAQLAQEPSNPGFADPDVAKFLIDPQANASWDGYATPEALQQRYANLGALGPDIFYLMLDYGGKIQDFEDTVMTIAGTFRCVGELSGEINNLIDSDLNALTDNVWGDIQATFGYLKGIIVDGLLDLIVDENNFWSFFLPMREVDNYPKNWYWGDFLHYVKTGCFTQKLLDNARAQQLADSDSPTALCLSAYALGYLSHYVADTVGHAYVNRIVESPWRNHWQRHHLVENFMDAFVWARYHDEGNKPSTPGDEQNLDTMAKEPGDPQREGAAEYHYARINDLCNIGSAGVDPILDGAISQVCDSIQKGLFEIGVTKLPTLQAPDDPIFTTWTEFVADTMWQTYPPDQEHPTRMGRYPTPDDIAGAYGAYRLVLSLSTEDDVDPPTPPNILGDLASIVEKMWSEITKDLGSVPPPPTVGGTSFSLEALWEATTQYIQWLGEVADAALQTLGALVSGLIEAGVALAADTIKAALFVLNSLLYSLYHSLRMTLVMSAYSVPFTEDLAAMWGPLDLTTLWTISDPDDSRYPIEPVVSERDFESNSSHPFSPYRPYFKPSGLAPVNVEAPGITFNERLRLWRTPSDMLEAPGAKPDDMFSADGPAPATTIPLLNPDGKTKLTDLQTFDGSQRYFGGVLANCITALQFAVPYLSGTSYPADTVLPDYNLDADRGYAWPCWEVDWSYQNPVAPFPWNGADPYPTDTLARIASGAIDWGNSPAAGEPDFRKSLLPNDPWGGTRHGDAWINATALSTPGVCNFADFPFPSIVVNPNRADLLELDRTPSEEEEQTNPAEPSNGLLTFDYRFADQSFLHSDTSSVEPADTEDVVTVYLHLPYPKNEEEAKEVSKRENDGRLVDFLRALARTGDAKLILANAASHAAEGPMSALPSPPAVDKTTLITAMAQLAVTGRQAFESFSAWTPDAKKLTEAVTTAFKDFAFDQTKLQGSVEEVLNAAYTALWAVRSNDPAWRAARPGLGWIAVSGFDDTPHRPINVPTAPYPQYDIEFDVPNANPDPVAKRTVTVTTRYMIASAHTFVGPDDSKLSSFTDREPKLLAAPASPPAVPPAPWSIPEDTPSIPPENKIIIYVHGGGSRAEEAVEMANWFIIEGDRVGENYTVISFDLPNSAYGAPIDIVKGVVGENYDYSQLWVLQFERQYIIQFIEALETHLGGNIRERVVAVMGGSLGGNMSMLMTDSYDEGHQPYLQNIVAWSVTAMAPDKFLGLISPAQLGAYLGGLQNEATEEEPPDNHSIERGYIEKMYTHPLLHIPPIIELPPQPIMWYRGGYDEKGTGAWQPLKDRSIARSRFDRYEIYSPYSRHWATAIDLEQIAFSFRDDKQRFSWVTTPAAGKVGASNLMLVAGDNDNFNPNAIYNSTIDVARAHRLIAQGKAEFWLDTGHSIHNERPHLFAKEIIYFLTHLTAGDSPNGTVVATPPKAAYSRTDR